MREPNQASTQVKSATSLIDEAGLPGAQRIVTSALGIACLAAGAVATFVTSNGAGSAALLVAGAGLLVLAFLGKRLLSVKIGPVEVGLQAARQLYASADELEAKGLTEEANELRTQADRLLMEAAPQARAFENLRRTEPPGPSRTAHQYDIVREAEQYGREKRPRADEVKKLFATREEGDRVFALVLMKEDPSVTHLDAILDAIGRSRSAFEQYQALEAAEQLLAAEPGLDPQSLGLLEEVLRAQTGGGWITPATDRWPVAQRMLTVIRRSGATGGAC